MLIRIVVMLNKMRKDFFNQIICPYMLYYLCPVALLIQYIQHCKRNILFIFSQRMGGRGQSSFYSLVYKRFFRQLCQRFVSSGTQNFRGSLKIWAKEPTHFALFINNRAVGKRIKYLFKEIATPHKKLHVIYIG